MNRVAIALAILAVTAGSAAARIHRSWDYVDLSKTADLIVIATAGATTDTGARETLPGISSMDNAGKTSPVVVERVETDLTVMVVLKGAPRGLDGKRATRIVLHHTRDLSAVSVNGPGLVAFDGKDHKQYLMFLVREPDGRYAAVSGQTDPDESIEPLAQRAP